MKKVLASILKWTGILILGLAVVYAVLLIGSTLRLRQAYAALAKDGRPMKAEDVIPPKVPDTENAALLYQGASLLLKAEPAGDENLLDQLGNLCTRFLKGELDPNERGELARLLQEKAVADALLVVERGTQRPHCRFAIDYELGPAMPLPHVSDLHRLGVILCTKARIDADGNRPAIAWRTVETCLRLADATRSEPLLVSQLSRDREIHLATETLQYLCNTVPPDDGQAAILEDLVEGFDDDHPFISAVDGDRLLLGEWAFNRPAQWRRDFAPSVDGKSHQHSLGLSFLARFRATNQTDHAVYLEFNRQHALMAQSPHDPRRDKAIEEHLTRKLPFYCFYTRATWSGLYEVKAVHTRQKAETRTTRIGLAALRYKQAHGSFPQTLDGIDEQTRTDPFTGKSIVYRVEGPGFVVYSAGPDQKDDGGISPPQGTAWMEPGCDIVWRFPGLETPPGTSR